MVNASRAITKKGAQLKLRPPFIFVNGRAIGD